MNLTRFLPFLDLQNYSGDDARMDVQAAIAVTFMSVPQGVAYAVIAGLPPAMGLYAGALPAIVGSLLRSSKHVVSGPTNALSLLVGTAIASTATDPVVAATTLALMVGVFQLLAGMLSLGAIVDYISSAVVLGYITGAGTLIAIGQLPNITATEALKGDVLTRIVGWSGQLGHADPLATSIALGTATAMLMLGRLAPKVPAAILAVASGIAMSWFFDLGGRGLPLVRDLAPVPQGLPPLTVPSLNDLDVLLPVAIATTVLSLIESSAVARSIASRSGQRVDTSVDFAGQGLSNLAAAFFGGYPTSGSLARSALNETAGARTRVAGALSGVFMLGILLFLGPIVDLTPVASLAGVLLVVAIGLVDVPRIRLVMGAGWSDRLAFLGTLIGTWTLSLDKAIYLGVVISIVLFLRKARLLIVRQLGFDADGRLREVSEEDPGTHCTAIRILHVEGNLFFGAANELRSALETHIADPEVRVLLIRLKRAHGLDATTAAVLASMHERMSADGRAVLLVGMTTDLVHEIERTGLAERFGDGALFPTKPKWFQAMATAMAHARSVSGDHTDDCPVRAFTERLQAPT